MNAESKKKLFLYVENANNSLPHPCDDERFVDFIKTSHMMKDISADVAEELEDVLCKKHFTESMIGSLVSAYEYGRLLLTSLNI